MNTINKNGQDIYFLLIQYGFNYQQARYITAQAAHETANFTSKIFLENNNPFGMKLARIRETTAINEKNGHANFTDIESAVKDFALYYKAFKYLTVYNSIDTYVMALYKNAYFEAPQSVYIKGLKHFYSIYFGQA